MNLSVGLSRILHDLGHDLGSLWAWVGTWIWARFGHGFQGVLDVVLACLWVGLGMELEYTSGLDVTARAERRPQGRNCFRRAERLHGKGGTAVARAELLE